MLRPFNYKHLAYGSFVDNYCCAKHTIQAANLFLLREYTYTSILVTATEELIA